MHTPVTNRAAALRWMEEVWNQRTADIVPQLMRADAIGHMEGAQVRGHEEFLKMRDALLGAMPDMQVHVDASVADGDSVVLRWHVTGTHSGDSLGIAPRNTPVQFRGMTWFRFEDGMLAEGWDAWNQGQLLSTLQTAALAPV